MPLKKYSDVPLWVDWVYRAFGCLEDLLDKLKGLIYWRFAFLDRHCSCGQCERRRLQGYQKPKVDNWRW